MKRILLVCLLFYAGTLVAANTIPAGTILPLELKTSLDSRTAKVGQTITARVAQDVPLPGEEKIRAGSKVIGHVVEVRQIRDADGHVTNAKLAIRFDTIMMSGAAVAVTANMRALASPLAVWTAQIPTSGPDRGTSQDEWTTVQVGDDEVVYGRGGPVTNGSQVVGESTFSGVVAPAASKPGSRCRDDGDPGRMRAWWVFSSNACGLYSLSNLELVHAGRTPPIGEIDLASVDGRVRVKGGSGLLLNVNAGTR